ncbi:uncharacterized protein LOC109841184 isoform X2 [Asparagus officinalis]|uniref:uncharacterized protein LOC109841184 isoform X2 n=1 Tax=Asparagus officinalis TaxID=4686 RepID=UPI00098E5EF6|nr:uncharacterized protein LOC109841184 isoform X2 [Asparagus officinalis]
MEDAWRSKCSSTWTPPPSDPPPPSSTPPPPAPQQFTASISANQVNKNPHQNFHPFVVQGTNLRPAVQQSLVSHTLDLDFAKSGKTELGNSFLALLSSNPHHLPSEFSQLPKLRAHSGGVMVSSSSPGAQITSIPSPAHVSTSGGPWTSKAPLFVDARPSLMPNCTRNPALNSSSQVGARPFLMPNCSRTPLSNSNQVETSHDYAFPSSKPVQVQAFAEKPSASGNWPSNTRPKITGQHHPLNAHTNQTSCRMPIEVGSSVPNHDSARFRGRPRVICVNTVGELFLSELGLLGVICFCHNLRMSVAKFCEHAGSLANPGEAVRLENGMTVSQWRKLCFGNNAPDDCQGWEWTDGPSTTYGFIGSRGSTMPMPQNPGKIDSFQTFVGLGQSGGPWNVYSKRSHTGVQQDAIKQPENKVPNSMYQWNRSEGEGFPCTSESRLSVLAKDQTVHAIEQGPDCLNPKASPATLNKVEKNVWSHLITNSDKCKGKLETASPFYPCSDAKSLSSELNRSRNNFENETLVVARDGNPSNIDLRLGQPSQVHTSLSYLSAAANPLQYGTMYNPQKSQVILPLAEKANLLKEQPRIGLWCTSYETSISNIVQSQHAVKSSSYSEPKELLENAAKNSLISFLSHLNTEGTSKPQVPTIVNDNKYSMFGSASAKCNLREHINNVNDGKQRNENSDGSNFYNNIGKPQPRLSENGSCDTEKVNHMVNNKQAADARVLMPATFGQLLNGGSSVDSRKFFLHFNQQSSTLQTGPDSMNFNYGKSSFGMNGDCCSHTANNYVNPVSYVAARSGLLNSGTALNVTSANSLYISEKNSSQMHAKVIDHSQHMTDDSMKYLALRRMVDLSKEKQSTATIGVNTRNRRFCCHSDTELQKKLCKGDSAAVDVPRPSTHHEVQMNRNDSIIRSLRSCPTCFSGNASEMLATKTDTRGGNEYCKCTTLAQRIPHCSKEQDITTCHVCWADEHPCLRFGRISTYGSGSAKQIVDQNEQSTSFYGNCCCSVLPKNLTGCCCTRYFSSSDSKKQDACGKDVIKHITQACDEIHRSPDMKTIDLCECTKNHFVMRNDCQTGLWRDVPTKKIGHSDATSVDKPTQEPKASGRTRDQLQEAASKGFEGTQQVESTSEQQMSNVCSGSSVPGVTEVSVEVNKVNYCLTNVEDNKTSYDFAADEGSGVEKCGSSDEALDVRDSGEDPALNGKVDQDKSRCSLPSQISGDLIEELRLESSSNKRKAKNQMHVQCIDQANIKKRKVKKAEKRKEQMHMNKLDMLVPNSDLHPINSEFSHCIGHTDLGISPYDKCKSPSQPETGMQKSSVKRKRSVLYLTESVCLKTKSQSHNLEFDKLHSVDDNQSLGTEAISSGMEELTVRRQKDSAKVEGIHLNSEKPPKYMSLSCFTQSEKHEKEFIDKKVRPVVNGKSGVITNGMSGQKRPPKFVSLRLILEKSKRCDVSEPEAKDEKSSASESRKLIHMTSKHCNELSRKLQCENEDSNRNDSEATTVHMFGTNKQCSSKSDDHRDNCSITENEIDTEDNREEEPVLHHCYKISQTRPKYREVRKCSLSKLLEKDKPASSKLPEKDKPASKFFFAQNPGVNWNSAANAPVQCKIFASTAMGDSAVDTSLGRTLNTEDHAGERSQIDTRSGKIQKHRPFVSSLDISCCVCGRSSKEEFNCLLECNRCLIRVHQACYGVSKVPKGHWFCRPCKYNSQNTVCVLCGYEGGAMTKAVKTQNIVKSLLKAWNFGTFVKSISSSETVKDESIQSSSVIEASKCKNSDSVTAARSTCSVVFPGSSVDTISQNLDGDRLPKRMQLHNSITAGILDPSVTQWVHMVCGLWTPGTRCPNVDTMSSFDVSGASAATKSTVCSICNRPGGCCIRCRVRKCTIYFHPWCAHQKGLLQSETEGDDNENLGFYGSCVSHAAQDGFPVDSHTMDAEVGPKKDWSCARAEGFRGQKSEESFKLYHRRPLNNDNGGCIVSQNQINAWLHINGQKSIIKPVVKPPSSDVEYDIRKEYFRYKQSKTWKHLVVYKSGIHALGLYTSQLIARGAMVVEYVGEIVGLRVADKREIEYQSGRKVQYKSACYFFRIDKEHIIDATRKGGIARFVNHSCQPNCVAKVISVRNEKKVVFFAMRDINPGEEITYDYHFNSEDEGQKIPCYCNSKNCRRYLN